MTSINHPTAERNKIFKKEPFFHGHDNLDQLVRIAKVLGTDGLIEYIEKYNLQLDEEYNGRLRSYPKRPWSEFINSDNRHLVNEDALSFLDLCLKYDHNERINTKDAMSHPYFIPVTKMYQKITAGHATYSQNDPEYQTARILLTLRTVCK